MVFWPQSKAPHIDGAAEQGAAFQRLEDDPVEVRGGLAEVVPLRHAAGEVLKALRGAATCECLVAAVHPAGLHRSRRYSTQNEQEEEEGDALGVGFLQQRAPELAALGRVHEEQLPVLGGQVVIHHHVQPLAKLPDLQRGGGGGNPLGFEAQGGVWGEKRALLGVLQRVAPAGCCSKEMVVVAKVGDELGGCFMVESA